jgi:hypothetical protein
MTTLEPAKPVIFLGREPVQVTDGSRVKVRSSHEVMRGLWS